MVTFLRNEEDILRGRHYFAGVKSSLTSAYVRPRSTGGCAGRGAFGQTVNQACRTSRVWRVIGEFLTQVYVRCWWAPRQKFRRSVGPGETTDMSDRDPDIRHGEDVPRRRGSRLMRSAFCPAAFARRSACCCRWPEPMPSGGGSSASPRPSSRASPRPRRSSCRTASTNISAGWSRCAPCSNPPTRKSPAASSRLSAGACSRIIRASFGSAGCQGSTARSAPNTRLPRSTMAFPATGSNPSSGWQLRDGAGERRIFSGVLLHRTEDLAGLRAGLFDRSGAAGRAGARAGQRSGHGVAFAALPAARTASGRSACSSACRSTQREHRGRRSPTGGVISPAMSRHIRSAAVAAVDPGHDGGISADAINVYPPGTTRGRCSRFFVRAPDTGVEAGSANGPHWSGELRIGDASWQVRATPAADGR